MSTPPKPHLTPEEYLEIERKAEFKSEYREGEMVAVPRAGEVARPLDRLRRPGEKVGMAGVGEAHSLILAHTIALLGQQLRSGPCRLYASDMRLYVGEVELYTYPDVMVVCGERRFLDEQRDTLLNPSLIVEVLSPATEAYDRGRKVEYYNSIESLQEYLLVTCDRVEADLYTRWTDGRWLIDFLSRPEDILELKSIGCVLKVADLYDKVEL